MPIKFDDEQVPGLRFDEQPVVPPAPSIVIDPPSIVLDQPDPTLSGALDQSARSQKGEGLLSRVLDYASVNPKMAADVLKGGVTTAASVVKAPGRLADAVEGKFGGTRSWKTPWYGMQKIADFADFADKEIQEIPSYDNPYLQGLGSAGAFMVGGIAAAPARLAPWLVGGGLGAAAGASSQYDEALAADATPDQALMAYLGGAAVGSSEALPMGWAVKKLNKLTGGMLAERLKEAYLSKIPTIGGELFAGLWREGLQEGFQQAGSNWVASDLAGYAPDRTLGENVFASALTGGLVGSTIGGFTGLAEQAMKKRLMERFKAEIEAKLATGDPINFLQGKMSPVQALVAMRQLLGQMEGEEQIAGEIALQQREGETGKTGEEIAQEYLDGQQQGVTDLIFSSAQGLQLHDPVYDPTRPNSSAVTSYSGALPIDTTVESAVLAKGEKSLTALEALNRVDTVLAQVNPYKHLQELYKDALSRPNLTPEEVTKWQELSARINEKIAYTKLVGKEVKKYLEAMRAVYSPDMKIIVTDAGNIPVDPVTGKSRTRNNNGFISITRDVPLARGPTQVATIFIDMDRLATEMAQEKSLKKDPVAKARRRIFETLTHEMGHALIMRHMQKIMSDAVAGNRGAQRSLALITDEYERWILQASKSNQDFFITSLAPLQKGVEAAAAAGPEVAETPMYVRNADWKLYAPKEYLLSFDEFFADMTARIASQGNLDSEAMTKFFKPVLKQYQRMFDKMVPEMKTAEYGKTWQEFLERQALSYRINQEIEKAIEGGGKSIWDALKGDVPGFDPKNFVGLRGNEDTWNKVMQYGFTLLQIAEVNAHVLPLQAYRQVTVDAQAYVRNLTQAAVITMRQLQGLGRIERKNVFDVLYEEASEKKLTPPAVLANLLNNEELKGYQAVRENLDTILNEMEKVSIASAQESFRDNQELLAENLKEISKEFNKMRTAGYFPYLRFGNYSMTATVRAPFTYEGEDYKVGQRLTFQTFETEKERDKELAALRVKMKGLPVALAPSVLRETDFAIQGMPRSMLQVLKRNLLATGTVDKELLDVIDRELNNATPFQSARKNWLKKKGVHGYSEDGMRAFAYYMKSQSGHLMRAKYAGPMHQHVKQMQDDISLMIATGELAQKRQEMVHWMERHFDYLMNPGNELAALRSAFSVMYLGFNLKSAAVQFLQIPQVVYPYLASRYGDAEAIKHLTAASYEMTDYIRHQKDYVEAQEAPIESEAFLDKLTKEGKSYLKTQEVEADFNAGWRMYVEEFETDPNTGEETGNHLIQLTPDKLDGVDPETVLALPPLPKQTKKQRLGSMIARGLHEQWIDQSFMTELAIASQVNNLDRMLTNSSAKKGWYKISEWAMLPMRLTEKANRLVTAIAAYNLQYEKEANHEKAVLAAREANWTSNYEYARWNRPEFTRGKKGVAFLFSSYLQHSLYFATHDPGAVRHWIMMMTLAGALGLPFADDLKDLVNFFMTFMKRQLGYKDPYTDVQKDMYEFLGEFVSNPDLILHGLGYDSFGATQVGEVMGVPIPQFNVSGSISMGNILPLTEIPGRALTTTNSGELLAESLASAGGASGNLVEGLYSAIMSPKPSDWKGMEKMVPFMAVRNLSKAVRMGVEGQETNASGEVIAKFDPANPREFLELVGQGVGFTPTRLTQGWERNILANNMARYYQVQRSALQQQFNVAVFNEDREAISDVLKAVKEYNATVPFPELGLGKEMRSNAKTFVEGKIEAGLGVKGSAKEYRLRKSVDDLYRDPAWERDVRQGEQP
jgi:hypothetical protein